MAEVSTTRLSSRGQVVIPEEIRRRLGLEPGAQFVVVGDADTVVLKRIEAPSLAEFDTLVSRARKTAKERRAWKEGHCRGNPPSAQEPVKVVID